MTTTPAASAALPELPPLPEPWIRNHSAKDPAARDHFAADQMTEYAADAVRAALSALTPAADAVQAARDNAEILWRALEVIALGDAKDPRTAAADALRESGHWVYDASLPAHQEAEQAPAAANPEQHPDFYTWTWDVWVSGGRWRSDYGWKRPSGTVPARNLKALYTRPASVEQAPAVPAAIARIASLLHTQNNRITDNPLFAVQQKRIVAGLEDGYTDSFAWVCDGSEVDDEEAARLEALREAGEPIPDDCHRVGYIETWEFVTGCFTEQGCKDYIAANGHNLKEPRIYAYGSYRNAEFIAMRKWLMSLASSPAPAVQPTSEAVARPSYDDLVWCLERIKEASTSYDTAFELSSKILDQVAVRRRYEAQQQAAAQPEAVADLVRALVWVEDGPDMAVSGWKDAMERARALIAKHGQPQGGSNG